MSFEPCDQRTAIAVGSLRLFKELKMRLGRQPRDVCESVG